MLSGVVYIKSTSADLLCSVIVVGKKNWSQNNRNQFNRNRTTGKGKQEIQQVQFISGKNKQGGRTQYGKNKGNNGYRRIQKVDRNPSLAINSEWMVVEEFDLSQLMKLVANPPPAEDLLWCGKLDQYNDAYEKLNVRSARILQPQNKLFSCFTTQDDPVMERFLVEDAGDIYATDSILAHLVASPRSVYSWDIVIEKTDGKIFLDKRDKSDFDLLTVSETAQEPPSDNNEEYNQPGRLSVEATLINQNFSQQILNVQSDLSKKVRACVRLSTCVFVLIS